MPSLKKRRSMLRLLCACFPWILCLVAIASIGPMLPTLFHERMFAQNMQELATDANLRKWEDDRIRSQVQRLARNEGFHIEFNDILIRYEENRTKPEASCNAIPTRIGYVLSLELFFFGLIRLPINSSRLFAVDLKC